VSLPGLAGVGVQGCWDLKSDGICHVAEKIGKPTRLEQDREKDRPSLSGFKLYLPCPGYKKQA
jgi:hypothetical protein